MICEYDAKTMAIAEQESLGFKRDKLNDRSIAAFHSKCDDRAGDLPGKTAS
jgi:hypothetical protein